MTQGKIYVVTGTSRGLGFEFVKQLLESGNTVVAGARNPSASKPLVDLQTHHEGRLHLLKLDVSDPVSIQAAAEQAAKQFPDGVDYLINNAGVAGDFARATEESAENVTEVLLTNVLGPHRTALAFLPLLRKGDAKTVVNMSSILGSLAEVSAAGPSPLAGRMLAYKTSKAALNMATLTLAQDLKAEGFTIIMLHPGWVATDMGSSTAKDLSLPDGVGPDLDAPTSVAGMIKVIGALHQKENGAFLDYSGKTMAW